MRLLSAIITVSLLALAPSLPAAKPVSPKPQSVIVIAGETVPVFNSKEVQPLRTVPPEYPQEERRKNSSGHAAITALVDVDGKVEGAEISQSTPTPAFGEAAKASVKKWRFPKVIWEGKPTKYVVQVPVVFRLQG